MPNSDDRFYLFEFRNRPVMYGDIGSLLRIEGVVYGGGGARGILLLPGTKIDGLTKNPRKVAIGLETVEICQLSTEEWSDFIHRTDDPEILVGPAKIFQRKLRWEISGAVQQKIWAADGFKCFYCCRLMGEVLMTIDHFYPLELGGKNDVSNYLSCCKPCNKDKGSEDPKNFCERRMFDFAWIEQYLKTRRL